jgi:hypothetical protein
MLENLKNYNKKNKKVWFLDHLNLVNISTNKNSHRKSKKKNQAYSIIIIIPLQIQSISKKNQNQIKTIKTYLKQASLLPMMRRYNKKLIILKLTIYQVRMNLYKLLKKMRLNHNHQAKIFRMHSKI